jgi:hypothetical protein
MMRFDQKHLAAVGKKTFDGEIKMSLVDGKIVRQQQL